MKIIVNNCYGGFSLSKEITDKITFNRNIRTDPELIKLIETKGSKYCSGAYADLIVCEIPDNVTDYIINDYDGIETIYYVLNGRIHSAPHVNIKHGV